jgi:undecaprenyl-diphosphatase
MELTFLKSLILGIVQGFTEFIPVSSTAHLILSAKALRVELSDFVKSFIVIIQFGSILAVIFLYWKKVWRDHLLYFKKIMTAFMPTAILGLIFYNIVKNVLHESINIIAMSLFLGGIAIIILERFYKNRKKRGNFKEVSSIKDISYFQCLMIGVFQSIAMIPGVSRSAATILGGLSLGIGRLAIVEFSFLLAVPTMLAASSLDLLKEGASFNSNEIILLAVGFLASFVVAIFSIKFLISFIKKNSFTPFGWYRVVIGLLIFIFLFS